ncbi:GNAT family N-acetyltransferase [Paenibacillus amylolyticus]|uniref:GNAT family N-acetyltransferase n=1 Tax=Paenibacillus amylolyticus TaxID=1451 RepID=UPI00201DDC56|nr:GNAT family N-acetyltransferase [Paenibacillus amylolyticus]MCL6658838.1 GNAT family N-acetyltransferase [Paenibacillus amylolyticus]
MKYSAERIYVRFWNVEDASLLLDLQIRNRTEIEKITASNRDDFFYSLEGQRSLIESWNKKREEGKRYSFGLFLHTTNELIGEISLFEIILHSTPKWIVGYVTDILHQGKGYMSEALQCVLEFAKHETEITRIEAGAVPENTGSIRVLQKAGFKENGSQPVPIQGTLKEHTMFAVDLL